MRTTTTLTIPTYSCSVVVIVTDDLEKEGRRIYKKHDFGDYEADEYCEAMVLRPSMMLYYLIFDKDYLTHNTLAHECYHVVRDIKTDRDIVDDEAGAWLMGHLSEFIYKFLQKKKLAVKHG